MLRALLLLVTLVHAVLPAATTGPKNVVIVANSNSALSKNIAEYYARKRGVPRNQICYLKTSTGEHITRAVYEAEIETPVARFLQQNQLSESVLYLVTTSEIPLMIAGNGDAAVGTDIASVDSELTLVYQIIRGQKHLLNGPLNNPYFKATASFSHPRFPIYLVTRLAAYDFNDVKAMIDRAAVAQNKGKFVVDLKGDASFEDEGNNWLRDTMLQLPTDRTVFDDGRKVVSEIKDVIAYASWGSNDTYRKERYLKMKWLPGAIATEFVSTNARTFERPPDSWTLTGWKGDPKTWWHGSPQTMSADYIHEGATGVSGHVWEPYLQYCPRPQYILPAYYKGENLAESFYRGIPAVSWQNIVLGDPLCSLGHP